MIWHTTMNFISSARGQPYHPHLSLMLPALCTPLPQGLAAPRVFEATESIVSYIKLQNWLQHLMQLKSCQEFMLQPKEQHSASCRAAFGWHRLEVPPHAKGCLDVSELSATGRTNLTGSRYMTMCSGEGEEVQQEKKAHGCETRKYLKFLRSTGASQGFLRGSGMRYLHRTLVSAANPLQANAVSCKTPRCYQTSWQSPISRRKRVAEEKSLQNGGKEWDRTESGWGNDNKCDRKRGKRPKASPDTHALPGVGDTMSTRLQFCCCSSATVLQWQLLTDTLFCYLARFSLKQHSPTHIYIYTYTDTHTPWDYIWYNTFQRLIKGRASVILCTSRIKLFTDCNETTEYCFN